jgi:hypothetical protein
MELFVCPKINDLDPTADGFDGGGHTVATHPATCQENLGSDRTCEEHLVAASETWRKFYGLTPKPNPGELRNE